MGADARLQTSLPGHPKTKKLARRVGKAGVLSLIWLLLWCVDNRSDGDLAGMTAEDIELAADWDGEPGVLVKALAEVGFLDGSEGSYTVHDWADHQPWAAGAAFRSAKARWNAVKGHHGEAEADLQVPEYAAIRHGQRAGSRPPSNADSSADSTAGSNAPSNAGSSAPLLSVSSPSPNLSSSTAMSGARDLAPPGFTDFWTAWPKSPRKEAKGKCLELWRKKELELIAGDIVQHVKTKAIRTDWAKNGGQFVEAPLVYLGQRRWEGADLSSFTGIARASAPAQSGFASKDYDHEHF